MTDFHAYLDEIAAVTHLLPAEPDADAGPTASIAHDAMTEHQREQRRALAEQLSLAVDEVDNDPLIIALSDAAADRDRAEGAVKRLIAYAREYAPGKRPSLRELASAARRSESWTSTAVTPDIKNTVAAEVLEVRSTPATATPVEPEFAAMHAVQTMSEDHRVALLDGADPAAIQARFTELDAAAARRVLDWARAKYLSVQSKAA